MAQLFGEIRGVGFGGGQDADGGDGGANDAFVRVGEGLSQGVRPGGGHFFKGSLRHGPQCKLAHLFRVGCFTRCSGEQFLQSRVPGQSRELLLQLGPIRLAEFTLRQSFPEESREGTAPFRMMADNPVGRGAQAFVRGAEDRDDLGWFQIAAVHLVERDQRRQSNPRFERLVGDRRAGGRRAC